MAIDIISPLFQYKFTLVESILGVKTYNRCLKFGRDLYSNMILNKDRGKLDELFIFVTTFFHFFISASTGASAPGCSGTVNAAYLVGLLGFHNSVCVVRGSFLFI